MTPVATALKLPSFLGANSVERVAIDIVYPICEMVEEKLGGEDEEDTDERYGRNG